MKEYPFGGIVDDLQYQLHPRLFLRMPITEPTELYKVSSHVGKKKQVDLKLPCNNYKFGHIGWSGLFNPKGLAQVVDQACAHFDLSLLTKSSGTGALGSHYVRTGADTFVQEAQVVPIYNLKQFKMTFSYFDFLVRRFDLLDFSVEPMRAFLDWHDYFDGPANAHHRVGLDPGVFCTQIVNKTRNANAARWYKGEAFMTFHDITLNFEQWKSDIRLSPELYVKKNLDQNPVPTPTEASGSSDKSKSKKLTKYCPHFNTEAGCKFKADKFCLVKGEKKWHKCAKKLGPRTYCQKHHSYHEHDEAVKAEKEGAKKD